MTSLPCVVDDSTFHSIPSSTPTVGRGRTLSYTLHLQNIAILRLIPARIRSPLHMKVLSTVLSVLSLLLLTSGTDPTEAELSPKDHTADDAFPEHLSGYRFVAMASSLNGTWCFSCYMLLMFGTPPSQSSRCTLPPQPCSRSNPSQPNHNTQAASWRNGEPPSSHSKTCEPASALSY